jgi:hypothetical protein
LFVHYRDAVNAGDGAAFLSRAAAEFAKSRKLVFKDSYWLDEHKLAAALAPVLAEFRAHGGMVDLR